MACFMSGSAKSERVFFRFCLVGSSLRRYLRALADWVAARVCWRKGGCSSDGVADAEREAARRALRTAERQEGQ